MGLVLKDKIRLHTQLGQSEVQLLFGDITQLTQQEKVDFIFVSAFPGDYAPVPGTLIGALRRNLDLSVVELAKNKASDLRKAFNCWVSHPLPPHIPYRQLVCFERLNRFEKLAEQISGMFRAMMPVFHNQDTTVITPLLASGNQGHSEMYALRAIVLGACHWIKAGLPLTTLKIVIYAKNPHASSEFSFELLEIFAALKAKWENKEAEASMPVAKLEKTIDVCLSFSSEDEEYVDQVCRELSKLHTDMVIHRDPLHYDHQAFWQEDIFTVMVNSRKIIAILTPNYVGKPECLEQFNLALCCNRLSGSEVLAPFYLQTVDSFPSYMTLIQYTECRVRKDNERKEEKISVACCMLVKEMDRNKVAAAVEGHDSQSASPSSEVKVVPVSDNLHDSVYDVFISYAHKTPTEAHKFHMNLLDIDPSLRVFLDRSELRTGNSWQEALYSAVDRAKVVVIFLTDHYVQSSVCQEEYNIALARYMSADGIYFLPLLASASVKQLPAMFSAASLVDMTGVVYEEEHFSLAETVVKWLEALKAGSPILNRFRLIEPTNKMRIPFLTANWRSKYFDGRFMLKKGISDIFLRTAESKQPQSSSAGDPTLESKPLSSSAGDPTLESKPLSSSAGDPTLESKPLSSSAGDPTLESKPLSSSAGDPTLESKPLSSSAGDPAAESKPLSSSAGDPTLESKPLSSSAGDPTLESKPLSSSAGDPTLESKGLSLSAGDPDAESKPLSSSAGDPDAESKPLSSSAADGTTRTVVFSFAQDCFKQASVLSALLKQRGGGRVTCEFLTSTHTEGVQAPKLQLLDLCDMVVLFVSDDYLDNSQHRHELHISLCRQRKCGERRVVYLIDSHHVNRQPMYAHLLHHSISLGDELWALLARSLYKDLTSVAVDTPDSGSVQMHCSGAEYLALSAAALDITDRLLHAENQGEGSEMPCNIVNLMTLKGTEHDAVPISEMLLPFPTVTEERPSHEDPTVTSLQDGPRLTRNKTSLMPDVKQPAAQPRRSVHTSRSCHIL
ncbi:uncharacterized protein LOC143295997 [Babylonia areolata]|uniref:uncharacterized protein LOC143295997 n=1 Tax=Babylonia areolata TaxID=304850 RepID=UPI003FD1E7B4